MKKTPINKLKLASIICWIVAAMIIVLALVLHPDKNHKQIFLAAFFAACGLFMIFSAWYGYKRGPYKQRNADIWQRVLGYKSRKVLKLLFWFSVISGIIGTVVFFVVAIGARHS